LKNNVNCPDCHKSLECIDWYEENNKQIILGHCDECINGVDADWKITLDSNNDIEKIERHFWG
jgi:hypothetical protein